MKSNKNQLGFQEPKGRRNKYFNEIQINWHQFEKDFMEDEDYNNLYEPHYSKKGNFIYDSKLQNKLLHLGIPCHYTDNRYSQDDFYGEAKIFWQRRNPITLKACIRKINKVRNIPTGTIVNFNSGFYYPKKYMNVSSDFKFKVKKTSVFDPEYQINKPEYKAEILSCERTKLLVEKLRFHGFIVAVYPERWCKYGERMDPEYVIAYGHGKRVGISVGNEAYMGYGLGCDNILWDYWDEFNKWSQCNEIPKTTDIKEIINILKAGIIRE